MCIPYSFLHTPVNKHLGRCCALALMNNSAMNIECKYLFEILILIPLDICLEVGLLDHIILVMVLSMKITKMVNPIGCVKL